MKTIIVLFIIFGFFFFLTYKRNEQWRDEKILSNSAIQLCPACWRSYVNNGKYYIRQKDFKTALTWFLKALEINPTYKHVMDMVAVCYYAMGDPNNALKYFKMGTPDKDRFEFELRGIND